MIFLWIGLVGFLVLLVTAVFGDHDGGLEHGGFEHDFSHEVGGHEAADTSEAGPSPFSVRSVGIFMTAFGFSGFLAHYHYGVSALLASGIGLVGGFAVAWLALQFAKLLYRQQGNSIISVSELVGHTAEVTNAIPLEGLGEVAVTYRGQRTDLLARSAEGVIPSGSKVKIVENLGAYVRVSKASENQPQ